MRTLLLSMFLLLGTAVQAEDKPAAAPATAARAATPLLAAPELAARIARKDADTAILDVRTPEEFAAGHVPGALNIPHDQVAVRLDELKSVRGKQLVVYCRSGRRAALAEDVLRQAGFAHLRHLEGDYLQWEAGGHPVDRAH